MTDARTERVASAISDCVNWRGKKIYKILSESEVIGLAVAAIEALDGAQNDEIARLTKERDEARAALLKAGEALEPFAIGADEFLPAAKDTDLLLMGLEEYGLAEVGPAVNDLNVGDFRRARKALAEVREMLK